MKLGFLLMAHKAPAQLERLLRAIHRPEHAYVIHVDAAAEPACHEVAAHWRRAHGNVALLRPRNCRWGGWSTCAMELAGLRALLRMPARWDYYVNLSGQDFPLRRPEEMCAQLEAQDGRSFMLWFDPVATGIWEKPLRRIRLWYVEVPFSKRVATLPRAWARDRRFLLRGGTWYGGSQWRVLSRSLAEWVATTPFWREKLFFRNTCLPDESFFQSVVLNSPRRGEVVCDDLRKVEWRRGPERPRIWREEDLPELDASPAFFARKFDLSVDACVLDALEARLARR
jgi:hypothetical protein